MFTTLIGQAVVCTPTSWNYCCSRFNFVFDNCQQRFRISLFNADHEKKKTFTPSITRPTFCFQIYFNRFRLYSIVHTSNFSLTSQDSRNQDLATETTPIIEGFISKIQFISLHLVRKIIHHKFEINFNTSVLLLKSGPFDNWHTKTTPLPFYIGSNKTVHNGIYSHLSLTYIDLHNFH